MTGVELAENERICQKLVEKLRQSVVCRLLRRVILGTACDAMARACETELHVISFHNGLDHVLDSDV